MLTLQTFRRESADRTCVLLASRVSPLQSTSPGYHGSHLMIRVGTDRLERHSAEVFSCALLSLVLSLSSCDSPRPESPPSVSIVEKKRDPVADRAEWQQRIDEARNGEKKYLSDAELVIESPWAAWRSDELPESLLYQIERLEISHTPTTDEEWAVLKQFWRLKLLRLNGPTDDADLARIAERSSLEILNLTDGQFTDAGLASLRQLPRLRQLRFKSRQVSDHGLKTLTEFPALKRLHLIEVPITDQGLTSIGKLTQLESFYLDGGNCSDKGLHGLLRELPELHFHYNQLHLPGDPNAD